MKKTLFVALVLAVIQLAANSSFGQSAPTGNDNQGSVAAPGGEFSNTPSASAINAYTANATRVVDDLNVPSVSSIGLCFIRYCSSRTGFGAGFLGSANWTFSFEWSLTPTTAGGVNDVNVLYPDGTYNTFTLTSTNLWTSTSAVTDYITQSGSYYQLFRSDNSCYTFQSSNGSYRLVSITDSRGQVTTLTYGSDPDGFTVLTHVTEPGGRYLTINYTDMETLETQVTTKGGGNPNGMPNYYYSPIISSVVTSDNRTVTFTYSTTMIKTSSQNGNQLTQDWTYYNYLTQATYSDNTVANYSYAAAPSILLTQANDVRAFGIEDVQFNYFTGASDPAGAVESVVEGTSNTVVTTVSLAGNNPQKPEVTYPDGSLYGYNVNSGGLLSSVNNTLQASNQFAYSSTSGSWTTTTTDANLNPIGVTRTVDGKLTSRTWPPVAPETVGPSESWTYNSIGSLISYTDTRLHTVTLTRDPTTDLVTLIAYPDTTSESYTYNSFGEVLSHTRRNGHTEYFTYDSTGLLQTEQDAVGNVTHFAYDSNYRIHTITDPRTNTTTFAYNDAGQTTRITHMDGTYQKFTYDTVGNLLTKTDELGNTTTYTYDGFRRVTTATTQLGKQTKYTYSSTEPTNSKPTLIQLPSGKQVSTTYQTGWGYQASTVVTAYGSSNPSTVTYHYDPAGNISSIADGNSKTTNFGYDARERKSWATDPASNETQFFYDDASNLTTEITPDGTSTMTYDTMNRLTHLNDAKNLNSSYGYDAEGKLNAYTDPNGKVYTYGYDYDERKLSTQYPDTTSQVVTYDPAGNVLTAQTRDNRLESLVYDNRNRNTSYSWNDGVTPSVATAYDSASRITSITNANSALAYTYDNDNEVLTEQQNVTGLGAKTVAYAYTLDGVLNTLTHPDGTVLTYGYDAQNNVTSIMQGSTTVVSYTYDGNNNRISKTMANGVASTLTYDNVERLTSITDTTPSPTAGTLLQKFQYGYDAMSRRTYVKRDNGVGDVYGYDTDDQVTSVKYNCTNPDTNPTAPTQTVSYTYDSNGNRTQVVDSVNGTTGYTPNSDNQYTAVGSNVPTYDGRGNLATFAGATYTYNANNQLTRYSDSMANVVTQAYDPLGRCVKRVINSVGTYFVYDLGWRPLDDYNGGGTQTNRYVNGPGPNEIINKTDATAHISYYSTDGLGSVTKLTSIAGAVVEQYSYDAWGVTTIKNASGTIISGTAYNNRFMYTGTEYVQTMNLYDMRNRFYSPTLARFLQPDPIGHSGDGYNIYRYCGNEPVNGVDPQGQFFIGAAIGFFTGGISGAYGASIAGGNIYAGFFGGALAGSLIGLVDPTEGFASVTEDVLAGAAAGAAAGAIGDVGGQLASNWYGNLNSPAGSFTPYQTNWDSVGASTAAGAMGGAVGGFYVGDLQALGAGEITTGIITSIIALPFNFLPAANSVLTDTENSLSSNGSQGNGIVSEDTSDDTDALGFPIPVASAPSYAPYAAGTDSEGDPIAAPADGDPPPAAFQGDPFINTGGGLVPTKTLFHNDPQ